MKNKIKNLLLTVVGIVFLFTSCQSKRHSDKLKVKTAHVQKHNDNGDDFWMWWYILDGPNNTYYTYSSPTQVSSYSNITWAKSSTLPEELDESNINTQWTEELVSEK